jgi:hypothetical protein
VIRTGATTPSEVIPYGDERQCIALLDGQVSTYP